MWCIDVKEKVLTLLNVSNIASLFTKWSDNLFLYKSNQNIYRPNWQNDSKYISVNTARFFMLQLCVCLSYIFYLFLCFYTLVMQSELENVTIWAQETVWKLENVS